MFFWGADLTSTSYVYSSLVQDDSGRVVGSAAVDAPIPDLRAGDVQVADHVPLWRDHLADAVTATLENGVVVQGPRDCGQWSSLHIAHEGNWFCWTHHLFTKGRNNFGSSICRKTNYGRKWHIQIIKQLPSTWICQLFKEITREKNNFAQSLLTYLPFLLVFMPTDLSFNFRSFLSCWMRSFTIS